jgi:ankyrin repeat protein
LHSFFSIAGYFMTHILGLFLLSCGLLCASRNEALDDAIMFGDWNAVLQIADEQGIQELKEWRDECGSTILHQTALMSAEMTGWICERMPELCEVKNCEGQTPLHLACHIADIDTVRILLSAGAAVDALDKEDSTPLFYASRSDAVLAVVDLLAAGADGQHINKNGLTPLMVTLEHKAPSVLTILLSEGASATQADFKGYSPLHLACYYGHLWAIKPLMNAEADVNIQDQDGDTPLHVATFRQKYSVLISLLVFDADPFIPNAQGSLPIDIARAMRWEPGIWALSIYQDYYAKKHNCYESEECSSCGDDADAEDSCNHDE